MTFAPQPKPRIRALVKRDKDAAKDAIDRREKAKVRKRSGGMCEVRWKHQGRGFTAARCWRRAIPGTHHLIFGIGRRNVGKSILAEHRLDVCQRCHDEITQRILVPVGTPEQRESAATVVYERIA